VLFTVLGTKNGYGLPVGSEDSPFPVFPLALLWDSFVSVILCPTPFFVAILIIAWSMGEVKRKMAELKNYSCLVVAFNI
jgi:hypothetical protein